jgi:CHAT domain-containing protein
MELRIPGAAYSPGRIERGKANSPEKHSQALLDANAIIGRELDAHPADPKWLQARGRADLIDLDYDSAIQNLQRALELQPDSPGIEIDLASAYYERALANSGMRVDYARAVDYLTRALIRKPDDPVAIFNRALCEERAQLYEPAIKDWEHYLELEPSGPWSDEARRNLDRVKKKYDGRLRGLLQPLLNATEVASRMGQPGVTEDLDARVETYLHDASTTWLPQAYPGAVVSSKNGTLAQQAQSALAALAQITKERHSDLWLSDLLTGTDSPDFHLGVSRLSQAIQANDRGDYSAGRLYARQSAADFRRAGNITGELRAGVEEIYSDHLLYDGKACFAVLHRIKPQVERSDYIWLRAQLSLEESNCAGLLGDLGTTEDAVKRGTGEAEAHNYEALYLRGLGFQADLSATLGDARGSFVLASEGLDRFWSDHADQIKGYNFYTDLDTAADVLRLPYFQVGLWEQATALLDNHPDVVQQAMAHRWFANSAYLANMPELAAREFARASLLFDGAPHTDAKLRGKMDADIWLAGLEVRQGDLKRAADRLETVRKSLSRSPAFGPEIGFYTAQAALNAREANSAEAESSFRSAIYLAEWALRSFSSPQARRQWAMHSDQAYRSLVAWRLQQGDAQGALEVWEWYRGAEFRTPRSNGGNQNLEAAIPPDARNAPPIASPTVVSDGLPLLRERTFVSYVVFPDGVGAWAWDDRGIDSRWLKTTRPELESVVRRFRSLCADPDSNITVLRSTARILYDLLLSQFERRLGSGRTIVFELDDVLSGLPMEALVDGEGHYVAERITTIVAPGFYQTLRLRQAEPITAHSPALVVSVPSVSGEKLPPIPDADDEAEGIAQVFDSTRVLKGQTAGLAAIREDLRESRVFHFVGHAVALPQMNGLLLEEQDPQTGRARMINSETLPPAALKSLQLAVLSACDTALTPETGDSGTEGLSQSLLGAGVSDVVASRWKVDSRSTAVLMGNFYQNLLAGESVVSALRSAELKLASQSGSAHPYYWAAFGVQGL